MTTVPAPADDADVLPQQPTIVLNLPPPPSANRIWRKVPGARRPTLSDEYRKWIEHAGWYARTQLVGVPTIVGTFNASVAVPSKSRRDRDNWTKPLFDLCQRVGAVRNDSGLRSYTVYAEDRPDCMVALFDLGGPAVSEPAKKRKSTRPLAARVATGRKARNWGKKKATPAQHARIAAARLGTW